MRNVKNCSAQARDQRRAIAGFLLDEAARLGMRFQTDGRDELAVYVPLKIDRGVRRGFEDSLAEYKREIIDLVRARSEERDRRSSI
jgi:hypothetical protein